MDGPDSSTREHVERTTRRGLRIAALAACCTVLGVGAVVAVAVLVPSGPQRLQREVSDALESARRQVAAGDVEAALSALDGVERELGRADRSPDARTAQVIAELQRRAAELRIDARAAGARSAVAAAREKLGGGDLDGAAAAVDDARARLARDALASLDAGRAIAAACDEVGGRIAAARAGAELDPILARAAEMVASDDLSGAGAALARSRKVLTGHAAALGPAGAKAFGERIDAVGATLCEREIDGALSSAERSFEGRQLTEGYQRAVMARGRLGDAALGEGRRERLAARIEAITAVVEEYRRIERTVDDAVGRGEYGAAREAIERRRSLPGDGASDRVLRRVLAELEAGLAGRERDAIDEWLTRGGEPSMLRVVAGGMLAADPLLRLNRGRSNVDAGVLTFERSGATFTARYDRRTGLRAHVGLGNRTYALSWRRLYQFPGYVLALAQRLDRQLRAARAGGGMTVVLGGVDHLPGSACLLVGRSAEGIRQDVFMDGATWTFEEAVDAGRPERSMRLVKALAALATAVDGDDASAREVQRPLSYVLRALYAPPKGSDQIDRRLVFRLLAEGYPTRVIEGLDRRAGPVWQQFTRAFADADELRPAASATNAAGDTLVLLQSLTGRSCWRRTCASRPGVTVFVVQVSGLGSLPMFVAHEFAGVHELWPSDREPTAVRVLHAVEGVVATYDVAAGRLSVDAEAWRRAVTENDSAMLGAHHGPGSWRVRPHVPVLDSRQRTVGIVLESGRLDVPSFPAEPGARRAAHDAFVDRVAAVLDTPGALGLFYAYFVEYVVDSPLEHVPLLVGSGPFTGDIHQDYHQFLDRSFAGRFLGDCDDLAEFFTVVTRRQGKLSYVLGMPSHATCGWVEDRGAAAAERRYELTYLDTGPPRHFVADTLELALRRGAASYDRSGTAPFDPQGIEFLFRFAGEPVRTPYRLGSRMFVDAGYAGVLTRVQEMWHFRTYREGIDVMTAELETRRVVSSVLELAALYRAAGQWDEAIRLGSSAVAELDEADVGSQARALVDLAGAQRRGGRADEALATVDLAAEKLGAVEPDAERPGGLVGYRIACADAYRALGRPAEAWNVLKRDALRTEREGWLSYGMLAPLTETLATFGTLEKDHGPQAQAQAAAAAKSELAGLLARSFGGGYFAPDDGFDVVMERYGLLASYFRATCGPERLVAELTKDGPYPDRERDHAARKAAGDEDWPWVRLSLASYDAAAGWMLDPEHPGRIDVAALLRLVERRLAAPGRANRLGVQRDESAVYWRLLRASLRADLDEFERVLRDARERNWRGTYAMVGSAVGASACLVTPAHFRRQMELFVAHVPSRPEHLRVAWDAFARGAFEHAAVAAEIAAAAHPQIESVQKEKAFLVGLARARLGTE